MLCYFIQEYVGVMEAEYPITLIIFIFQLWALHRVFSREAASSKNSIALCSLFPPKKTTGKSGAVTDNHKF